MYFDIRYAKGYVTKCPFTSRSAAAAGVHINVAQDATWHYTLTIRAYSKNKMGNSQSDDSRNDYDEEDYRDDRDARSTPADTSSRITAALESLTLVCLR